MIKRNRCSSLQELAHLIRIYIGPFSILILRSSPEQIFIVLTGEAYVPCVYEERGRVVVKSWVSRPSYTDRTEAKLKQACDYLMQENRVAQVPEEIFPTAMYLASDFLKGYIIGP